MPRVPDGTTADPFGNRIKGKQQDRVVNMPLPTMRPSPTDLAIAAATMHEQGRLFEPVKDASASE